MGDGAREHRDGEHVGRAPGVTGGGVCRGVVLLFDGGRQAGSVTAVAVAVVCHRVLSFLVACITTPSCCGLCCPLVSYAVILCHALSCCVVCCVVWYVVRLGLIGPSVSCASSAGW